MKSKMSKHTFSMLARTHTNSHLWASLQEGVEALQPEWRQGNVVSDHLIGLAPDRQRLLRQLVRGPKLTLKRHFGSGWLHAERLRKKTKNVEPQSFCLCHYWSLFNRWLAAFTSSGHINTFRNTVNSFCFCSY